MKYIDEFRDGALAKKLAADIQRYLANEPVLAASPSRIYKVRKFIKR